MRKIKLEDLKCVDDLYYVGDIYDVDGNPWVDKQSALAQNDFVPLLNSIGQFFGKTIGGGNIRG